MQDNDKNNKLYECPECGLHYESEDVMKECEAWCKENKSCNVKITKLAAENQTQK